LPRDCLVVLAFHRVGDDLPPWHFGVTPRDLERVVSAFAAVASPTTLADVAREGIRGRLLAVTFDDGFKDGLEIAAPLLTRLGVPAAFFLAPACIDEGAAPWPDVAYARLLASGVPLGEAHAHVHTLKSMAPRERDAAIDSGPPADDAAGVPLTWQDARSLVSAGFEVGAHGLTHAVLTGLDDQQLRYELREARTRLRDRVGVEADVIAYPDNQWDARVVAEADAAGFRLGLGGGGTVNLPGSDLLTLQRVDGEDRRVALTALRAVGGRRSFAADAVRYQSSRDLEYGFMTQARLVSAALSGSTSRRVLDAGCGTGSLVPTLESVGVEAVVGVDAEPAMVEAARQAHPQHVWEVADVTALTFEPDSFDAAVLLGVLEYLSDPAAAVRGLVHVVSPGGRVIVSVPQARSPNQIAVRLAGILRPHLRDKSRPLTRRHLLTLLRQSGVEVSSIRATNFYSSPFDLLAPSLSRRVAEALDVAGSVPVLRRLGSQLVAVGTVAQDERVFWLAPAFPTETTFLDRELEALRAIGIQVEPMAPPPALSGLVPLVRSPIRGSRMLVRLQRLKARRDTERGWLGYLALGLRGLALARKIDHPTDRVHATFADGIGTVAYVAAQLANARYTFTAHSPYSLYQGSRLLARQSEDAEAVACVSLDVERRLLELAPGAATTIVRCAAPEVTRLPGAAPTGFVAVGRLIPHKGFLTAIRAVAKARELGADLSLSIIGDGPQREELDTEISRLGLERQVSLLGWFPNPEVLDRVAESIALLAPCEIQADGDRDGLPVTIIDAAACGVPSIATPVGGIPDLVADGATGLLVPERDPDALAEAMIRIAGDAALRTTLGAAARELVRTEWDARLQAIRLAQLWRVGVRARDA
jgi:glycosyltransferase involved in cell wall biosynthesis/peptidoglycan/xylan/chitin deacetylase (PgdA/CDA1 family)